MVISTISKVSSFRRGPSMPAPGSRNPHLENIGGNARALARAVYRARRRMWQQSMTPAELELTLTRIARLYNAETVASYATRQRSGRFVRLAASRRAMERRWAEALTWVSPVARWGRDYEQTASLLARFGARAGIDAKTMAQMRGWALDDTVTRLMLQSTRPASGSVSAYEYDVTRIVREVSPQIEKLVRRENSRRCSLPGTPPYEIPSRWATRCAAARESVDGALPEPRLPTRSLVRLEEQGRLELLARTTRATEPAAASEPTPPSADQIASEDLERGPLEIVGEPRFLEEGDNAPRSMCLRLSDGRKVDVIAKRACDEGTTRTRSAADTEHVSRLRAGVPRGTSPNREQAMFILDDELGGDRVVPVTVARPFEGELHSLQVEVKNSRAWEEFEDQVLIPAIAERLALREAHPEVAGTEPYRFERAYEADMDFGYHVAHKADELADAADDLVDDGDYVGSERAPPSSFSDQDDSSWVRAASEALDRGASAASGESASLAHAYHAGLTEADEEYFRYVDGELAREPSVRRTVLLDVIAANDDRHDANVLYTLRPDGSVRAHAIDNGSSNPRPGHATRRFLTPFGERGSVRENLIRFSEDVDLIWRLRSMDTERLLWRWLAAALEPDAAAASLGRLRALQRNPDLLLNHIKASAGMNPDDAIAAWLSAPIRDRVAAGHLSGDDAVEIQRRIERAYGPQADETVRLW